MVRWRSAYYENQTRFRAPPHGPPFTIVQVLAPLDQGDGSGGDFAQGDLPTKGSDIVVGPPPPCFAKGQVRRARLRYGPQPITVRLF